MSDEGMGVERAFMKAGAKFAAEHPNAMAWFHVAGSVEKALCGGVWFKLSQPVTPTRGEFCFVEGKMLHVGYPPRESVELIPE